MRSLQFVSVFAVVMFSLVGCGLPPEEPLPLGEGAAAIVNGQPDTIPAHKAVVALLSPVVNNVYGLCTATIVHVDGSDGYALTAAHCFDDPDYPPTYLRMGDDYADGAVEYIVDAVTKHPKWPSVLAPPENAAKGGYDFAILHFHADPVPPFIAPMTPFDDDMKEGTEVEIVGYGETELGSVTHRRRVTGHLERIPGLGLNAVDTMSITYSMVGGGTCYGDSGGPVLVNGRVAGVISWGDPSCAEYDVPGRVSHVYDDFIAPALGLSTAALTSCVDIRRGGMGNVTDGFLSGDFPKWVTGADWNLHTGASSGGNINRAVFRPDLSALPSHPSVTVTSAALEVSVSWNEQNSLMGAHNILKPWSESSVSAATLGGPDDVDPDPVDLTPVGGPGYKSFDVTPLAAGWHDGSIENNGVMLQEPPTASHHMYSSESSASVRPFFHVCYAASASCSDGILNQGEHCTDCGGPCGACPAGNGAYVWGKRFGDATVGEQIGHDVATGPSGELLTIGLFKGTLDFGASQLTSHGQSDVFLTKYLADGTYVWSRGFGATANNYQDGRSVAVGPTGDIAIVGSWSGGIDFGATSFLAEGTHGFVAKLAPSGTVLWNKIIGGAGPSLVRGVAMDPQGNMAVTGLFDGTIDIGGKILTSGGYYDVFVARYDSAGNVLWAKRYGSSGDQRGERVDVDGDGNVTVAGSFMGAIDFGTGAMTSAGGTDVFVAAFTPAGQLRWCKQYGGFAYESIGGLAVSRGGDVLVTGSFLGTVSFGGSQPMSSNAFSYDAFVLKLDRNGQHVWSKSIGSPLEENGRGIDMDASDNVVFTGTTSSGILDLGGGPVGGGDIFIAKLTSQGDLIWGKMSNGNGTQIVQDVAMDGCGRVSLTGKFDGTLMYGGGPVLTTAGGWDAFVLRLTQ